MAVWLTYSAEIGLGPKHLLQLTVIVKEGVIEKLQS